ncbi:MAG: N-formylglutamate amidohydrolase [Spirochaetales bacterium]|nr:N-formylglutamate amidohydrolase [Spirochaetales bacterium]
MIVLHIPHSSTRVPEAVKKTFTLSEEELAEEVFLLADMYTDELFDVRRGGVERIVFPVNRLVLDPERFTDDAQEEMAARGMGVVYTVTAKLRRLRKNVTPEERHRLIDTYYTPHHRLLEEAVRGNLSRCGRCLIVDCHSFASRPLPYETDRSADRPDICIGTDAFHTPPRLIDFAAANLASSGYGTDVNRPFSGSIVPPAYYRQHRSVFSIMLEINKRLYMNETTGEKLPGFDELKAAIRGLIDALFDASPFIFS